jgi:hypothetical protein
MAMPAQRMSGQARQRKSFYIATADRAFARMLMVSIWLETIRLAVLGQRPSLPRFVARSRANVAIYAFDRREMDAPSFAEQQIAIIGEDGAIIRIFLQLASAEVHGAAPIEIDEKNRTIETMARRCGAHLVAMSDLMRVGVARRLKKSGKPNWYGFVSIAHMILRSIRVHDLQSSVSAPSGTRGSVRGMAEVPAASEQLANLTWPDSKLPANLARSYSDASIKDFMANIVSFSAWPQWGKFPLGDPVDWSAPGANLTWQSYFTGLEFLRPPLSLAFDAASGTKLAPEIIQVLQGGGTNTDDLFDRASAILADFIRNNPSAAAANRRAYSQGTICRRIETALVYFLCCKRRADCGLAIDIRITEAVAGHLVQCLDLLSSDEVYPKDGNHGARQDILFMLTGLLFPNLEYGRQLMALGIDRLRRYQVGKALSADGVWLENSFGYHCWIVSLFTRMLADMRTAGAPDLPLIREALQRMLPFVEALIKVDGQAPLIGGTGPGQFLPTIVAARRELALTTLGDPPPGADNAPFVRAQTTYCFPESGYFASHSKPELSKDSSSVIFLVTLSNTKHKHSDDLSVLLSHGADDLLIDGGTFSKQISDSLRNAARFDPASHNTFRVNGGGYILRAVPGLVSAGLMGMWEKPGWAAALGYNHAYPDARIVRAVIHLKNEHAVIVLDRLASKTSREALFEQFWHLSPDLALRDNGNASSMAFDLAAKGRLLAAFDASGPAATIEYGNTENPIGWAMRPRGGVVPTPYIRRTLSCQTGTMASAFQWSRGPGGLDVAFHPSARGAVEISARGGKFAARFRIDRDAISCIGFEHSAEPPGIDDGHHAPAAAH